MGIQRLANFQSGNVISADTVEENSCVRALCLVDAHMSHIEQTGRLAGCQVLLDNRRVPDRHFPTGKGDDLCAELAVGFEKWRAAQVFGFFFLPGECR